MAPLISHQQIDRQRVAHVRHAVGTSWRAAGAQFEPELANILDTGKVSVGGLIDRLEEAGLIYRKSGGTDRRVKRIFTTAKGYEILAQIAWVGDELDRHLFAHISEAELAAPSDVLARVKQNIRAAIQSKAAASILAGHAAAPLP